MNNSTYQDIGPRDEQQDRYYGGSFEEASHNPLVLVQKWMEQAKKKSNALAIKNAGATIVIAAAQATGVAVGYIGDSRAFMVAVNSENGEVLVRAVTPFSQLHKIQAVGHQNEITKALSPNADDAPTFVWLDGQDKQPGCKYYLLLTSDGIETYNKHHDARLDEPGLLWAIGRAFTEENVTAEKVLSSVHRLLINEWGNRITDNTSVVLMPVPTDDGINLGFVIDGHLDNGGQYAEALATHLAALASKNAQLFADGMPQIVVDNNIELVTPGGWQVLGPLPPAKPEPVNQLQSAGMGSVDEAEPMQAGGEAASGFEPLSSHAVIEMPQFDRVYRSRHNRRQNRAAFLVLATIFAAAGLGSCQYQSQKSQQQAAKKLVRLKQDLNGEIDFLLSQSHKTLSKGLRQNTQTPPAMKQLANDLWASARENGLNGKWFYNPEQPTSFKVEFSTKDFSFTICATQNPDGKVLAYIQEDFNNGKNLQSATSWQRLDSILRSAAHGNDLSELHRRPHSAAYYNLQPPL